jgi:hypothetical protein
MALFGTGVSTKYWRSGAIVQPDGLSAAARPFWVSCWAKGSPGTTAGLALFGITANGTTGANAGIYYDPAFTAAFDYSVTSNQQASQPRYGLTTSPTTQQIHVGRFG